MDHGILAPETAVGALVAVAVHSSDLMSKIGIASMLSHDSRLKILADEAEFMAADVILIVEDSVCNETLSLPEQIRATSPLEKPPRCVIVADHFPDNMLVPAIECGMSALVMRNGIDIDKLAQAIIEVSQGMACLPIRLQAGLIAEFDRVINKILRPRGIDPSGMSTREHEVIRLMANGYSNEQIAVELSYSGSLIKKIVKELSDRYGFRNRSHVVAYAIRCGII